MLAAGFSGILRGVAHIIARKIALPFGGDTWAQPGAQMEIPDDIPRFRVTGDGPFRARAIAKDSVDPSAETVDGDGSTLDLCLVKVSTDERGNVTLSRTASVFVVTGAELLVGQQMTEDDVSAGETFAVGIVSATQDTADAIFVYIDAGARLAE